MAGGKSQKAPELICLCYQDPEPPAAYTFIASTTKSTLCHEVSYNLTFSQLAVLYYSLNTQVSLAQKANWAMSNKEIM